MNSFRGLARPPSLILPQRGEEIAFARLPWQAPVIGCALTAIGAEFSAHRPSEVDVIRVESILPAASKRLITIRDEARLMDAAKLLREPGADLVVVCNADGSMAGVISKTDIVRQISLYRESEPGTAASTIMTRKVVSCRPGDLLHDVLTTMKEQRLKNVPILDQELPANRRAQRPRRARSAARGSRA